MHFCVLWSAFLITHQNKHTSTNRMMYHLIHHKVRQTLLDFLKGYSILRKKTSSAAHIHLLNRFHEIHPSKLTFAPEIPYLGINYVVWFCLGYVSKYVLVTNEAPQKNQRNDSITKSTLVNKVVCWGSCKILWGIKEAASLKCLL